MKIKHLPIVLLTAWILWGHAMIAHANPGHEILLNLLDEERTQKLTRLMQASNEPCEAASNFFQGLDAEGNAYWDVTCKNRKSYAIMIYNNPSGSTKILECGVLKLVTGVGCFTKFEKQILPPRSTAQICKWKDEKGRWTIINCPNN